MTVNKASEKIYRRLSERCDWRMNEEKAQSFHIGWYSIFVDWFLSFF